MKQGSSEAVKQPGGLQERSRGSQRQRRPPVARKKNCSTPEVVPQAEKRLEGSLPALAPLQPPGCHESLNDLDRGPFDMLRELRSLRELTPAISLCPFGTPRFFAYIHAWGCSTCVRHRVRTAGL